MKAVMDTTRPEGTAGHPPVIEASGLTRIYKRGGQRVVGLRAVDLTIPSGEFLAITGPSGSGKSTLLHLLGGLDRPDDGEVRLEGRSLSKLSESQLAAVRRRRVGFVLQFFNLLPTLSALRTSRFHFSSTPTVMH